MKITLKEEVKKQTEYSFDEMKNKHGLYKPTTSYNKEARFYSDGNGVVVQFQYEFICLPAGDWYYQKFVLIPKGECQIIIES